MTSDAFTRVELADLRLVLRSALVADALDAIGLHDRALGPEVVRMSGKGCLVGRAFTVATEHARAVPDVAYAGLRRTLEALRDDDVCVLGTDRSDGFAVWGEVVSMAAAAAGAAGVVTDGLVRDQDQVDRLGFPVFARGTCPVDIHGRAELVGQGRAVTIGPVRVARGDLVVGDRDGVVVVPSGVQREAVRIALEKGSTEAAFRVAVAGGLPVLEALARFDIL